MRGSSRPAGELQRLVVGMTAIGAFTSFGVLHLYGVLPVAWHVGASVGAVLLIGVLIASQDD